MNQCTFGFQQRIIAISIHIFSSRYRMPVKCHIADISKRQYACNGLSFDWKRPLTLPISTHRTLIEIEIRIQYIFRMKHHTSAHTHHKHMHPWDFPTNKHIAEAKKNFFKPLCICSQYFTYLSIFCFNFYSFLNNHHTHTWLYQQSSIHVTSSSKKNIKKCTCVPNNIFSSKKLSNSTTLF